MKKFSDFLLEAYEEESNQENLIQASGTFAALYIPEDNCSSRLYKWLEKNKIDNLVEKKEYHCTIVHSTHPVPDVKNISLELPISATIKEWKILGKDNMLVIVLESREIVSLHEETKALGAKWEYAEFIPHISVAFNYKGELPQKLPNIKIKFTEFKVSALDQDFEYKTENK